MEEVTVTKIMMEKSATVEPEPIAVKPCGVGNSTHT
jgi:hypothetical protein